MLLYRHSQSRRVRLTLLICVSRQQPISTIGRQHSLRTGPLLITLQRGRRYRLYIRWAEVGASVRGPLQIKAGADEHFKVSVESSDPTMTAARASLKARDEIALKARRSRYYGVELPWLLSYGENK
jgi:hypothetical protein